MKKWSIKNARDVYNITNWSDGYFDIDDSGLLAYCDQHNRDRQVSFSSIIQAIKTQGLHLPVLVRFSGILRDRLKKLVSAFDQAHKNIGYSGRYTIIYPIKVNQQRSVVEDLLEFGDDRVGLEAGSKPELLAVMSAMEPGGVIVCNGYKDREFIELSMAALAIGFRVYVVIEKLTELDLLIKVSRETGLKPNIGLRIRLASTGSGNWQNSGGDKSKFGLASSEVLQAIEMIKTAGLDDCLAMIHFHMGSQIANLDDINQGMREAMQYYAQCCRLLQPVGILNVGGGLGIDYEGTKSRSYFSKNYSSEEYAQNVSSVIKETCAGYGLPEPDIFSESGRALTAHHAVLLTDVLEVEKPPRFDPVSTPGDQDSDEPEALRKLRNLYKKQKYSGISEAYHQLGQSLAQVQLEFSQGKATLRHRAEGEGLYVSVCLAIRDQLDPGNRRHREILDEINEKLVDKYFCNFSVFQSVPDVWAMQQVFPIMPVQRLDERPDRRGVVVDVTCDSDGRLDHYVDNEGVEASLPLHQIRPGQDYFIAIFLVGAYQEILGDMHNLFGDTDSVHVAISETNEVILSEIVRGDTVSSVLDYVHYSRNDLVTALERKIMQAGQLQEETRKGLLQIITRGLDSYTYLKNQG